MGIALAARAVLWRLRFTFRYFGRLKATWLPSLWDYFCIWRSWESGIIQEVCKLYRAEVSKVSSSPLFTLFHFSLSFQNCLLLLGGNVCFRLYPGKELSTGSLRSDIESKRAFSLHCLLHNPWAEYRSLNTKWPFLSCLLRWFNGFYNGFATIRLGKSGLGALCSYQPKAMHYVKFLPYQYKLVTT